jgi:uncharacterized protein with PQ loop repeat
MSNFLLNLLPTIATVFLTLCYLPQIFRTYKTKDVQSMSLSFWILLNLALTCLLINAIVIFIKFGTWGYALTETLNEGLAFVMLIMVIKYKK